MNKIKYLGHIIEGFSEIFISDYGAYSTRSSVRDGFYAAFGVVILK